MKFPNHAAIIMDGNRRWAQQHGLPSLDGHRAGVESMYSTIEYLGNHHLKYLTIYGFSTENWHRDPDEIEGLFHLFIETLNKESPELNKRGVRLRHLGRLNELPPYAQLAINTAVELTKNNTEMTISFAVNYGGSIEIVDAVRQLIDEGIPSQLVDEELFSRYLYTDGLPDIDLLIRTGGELRLSNFLIWQARYSEYYFTEVLWPDFNTEELEKALQVYSERQRRFGGD
ncbi:Ditrans,polycis-undecaprenyl-diphosphate synthase ((2E,6E)-farnesyl-diphosphate specific) [subsurface metagenome]